MNDPGHRSRLAVDGIRSAWPILGGRLSSVLCVVAVTMASAGASQSGDEGPAIDRPDFWKKDRSVIQAFGNVFAFHDKADIATQYYWTLDDSAIGKVIEVIPGGRGTLVRAEFPDETGWERVSVPPPKTEIKWNFDYDNYGRPESATATVVRTEGIMVAPREWGRIIDEAGQRRVVEFPAEIVGLRRPQLGDRVLRGPDWRAGYADGGENPVGPASPDCYGEVLEELGMDRYVKVRWDKTGREGFYRFDKRRYYDVEVVRE